MTTAPRTGKSLIEMVFVIAVIGMVMTIAAKTMVVVLNRERSGRDAFTANSDRSRLASDFRRDVNAAQSTGLSEGQDEAGRRLQLTLPEHSVVEYSLQEDEIIRVVKQAETISARERYRIGYEDARFAIEPGDRELVSIIATITHRPETASVLQRQLRIDAVTGKDLRYQDQEGTP